MFLKSKIFFESSLKIGVIWPWGDQQVISRVISYGILLSFRIGAARDLLVAKIQKNLFKTL